ncbi:MAG: type II toxin-antitoxin system RelE/ParE family toxin [Desulfovibrionaceae bacterium]|nr:type II toxin-antitoxin system RelE/ParE family toxin [Desulfovibrionaceae bacterium]
MYEVHHYLTVDGRDPVGEWLLGLRDRKARVRLELRISRIELGNLGDCKPVRAGVHELRIDHGPGYRVYFAVEGKVVVLLLCGGDKRSQEADIGRALAYLADYKERTK